MSQGALHGHFAGAAFVEIFGPEAAEIGGHAGQLWRDDAAVHGQR